MRGAEDSMRDMCCYGGAEEDLDDGKNGDREEGEEEGVEHCLFGGVSVCCGYGTGHLQ